MTKYKLSFENKKKLYGAIEQLYEFCQSYDVSPMVLMHLQQAAMHQHSEICNEVRIPVTVYLTAEQFDYFIASVMVQKPVPTNQYERS